MSAQLIDVQARWGYSKFVDATFSHYYDHRHQIEDLRAKRSAGVPFDQLSGEERYSLAILGASVRERLLIYQVGTEPFEIVEIEREALAKIIVPPNVWEQARFAPLHEYFETTTESPDDARNVVLKGRSYERPTDPVTIGRWYENPVLIDGYHRAALFWKFCSGGTLPAYVPRIFLSA